MIDWVSNDDTPLYENLYQGEFQIVRFSRTSYTLACPERSMRKVRPDFELEVDSYFRPQFEDGTILITYENWRHNGFENLEWLISRFQNEKWSEHFSVIEVSSIGNYFQANLFGKDYNLMLPASIKGKCGLILSGEGGPNKYFGSDGRQIPFRKENRHIK